MAKEKAFDYKQASEGELFARLQKTQQDLFKLRFRAASAPLKNTMMIQKLRRETARINTFMNQRGKKS
jgi:large subunit ribosomal protein L29